MGWFKKTRYVVSTVMVGVDGRLHALLDALAAATDRIVDNEGNFAIASEEIARIAGALLEHEGSLTHVANWGEVFDKEDHAGQYGDEVFSECAGRYLSSGLDDVDESRASAADRAEREGSNIVVMLTVGYQGEVAELEKTLSTRTDLEGALSAIIGLHHQQRLDLAHIHYAPGHADDILTDDQLDVNYPELIAL